MDKSELVRELRESSGIFESSGCDDPTCFGVTVEWDKLADFIIADRLRIVEPLVKACKSPFEGTGVEVITKINEAVMETLNLAGAGGSDV
jgi:hypothetical protein